MRLFKRKNGRCFNHVRKDELQAMIDEDHGCEINCQFCNTKYQFDENELKAIKKKNLIVYIIKKKGGGSLSFSWFTNIFRNITNLITYFISGGK